MKDNYWSAVFLLLIIFTTTDVSANNGSRALLESALRVSPEYTRPVLKADGEPLAIFHELNGDGRVDVVLITVLAETGVPQRLDALRQNSRLFRRGDPHPLFVLETYFAGDEAVQTVELGRWPAFDRIELLNLVNDQPFPVAIAVRTRGAAGSEYNLIIYSRGGMIRRVRLEQSDRARFEIGDLDRDGALDIVRTLRLPEAGRGYETFVEFLSLQDGSYVISDSFALVRELREFLDRAAEHMTSGRWESLAPMISNGTAGETVALSSAFHGVADDEAMETPVFDYPLSGTGVDEVVFPPIMENPIPYPFLGERFSIVFRVECCDELPRFYSAVIGLSAFPFEEKRFSFLTDGRAGQ